MGWSSGLNLPIRANYNVRKYFAAILDFCQLPDPTIVL